LRGEYNSRFLTGLSARFGMTRIVYCVDHTGMRARL
jgi:hypothetical protein